MKCQKYTFIIFISILAMLQGCITRTIKIDPIPELKIGSPLAGIESLTFKINEFKDVRSNKKLVGACRVGPKIELEEQKVPEIITQTIANEMKRNGHKVLQTGEADKADVIIVLSTCGDEMDSGVEGGPANRGAGVHPDRLRRG